jgi:phage terminase small subunit
MAAKALNPKQQRFVAEYLIDLNKKQAAVRAGYSERTAEQIGYQLLQKTSVAAAVAEGIAKRAGKLEITAEKVLRDIETARINAMATMEWSPAIRASELQGKHIGMFADTLRHTGPAGGPVEMITLRGVRAQ